MKDMNCEIPKVEGYGLIPLVANALNYLFISPDCETAAPVSAAVTDMVEVADNVTNQAPVDITVVYDPAIGKFVPGDVSAQYLGHAQKIADNAEVIERASSAPVIEAVKSAKIIEPKAITLIY